MRKGYLFFLAFLLSISSIVARERILLNEGWRFQKLDSTQIDTTLHYNNIKPWVLPSGNNFLSTGVKYKTPDQKLKGSKYATADFNDSGWRLLDLPHDWGIEGPFIQEYPGETAKLPWMGVAWYRKQIDIPKSDANKKFILEVDGALSYSTVWVNGEFAGGWPYGYASFQIDLTPFIKIGQKNQIAIRVDNPDNSSRWYPGGGIYRNVWLTTTDKTHVDQWGTFVKTPEVSKERAKVDLNINILNSDEEKIDLSVVSDIYEQDDKGNIKGNKIASATSKLNSNDLRSTINQSFDIESPKIWDIESPNMYVVVTRLLKNGEEIDQYTTPFGIRTIEFTANDGFHLNGRRVILQGVCMHHDHGSLGAAFHYRAMERQIEILKEMGVNAIRTSHNPPAPEMLELCDRMGILVLDEIVDTWTYPKKPNGYSSIFNEWHEQDLRAFIHRDRNHPSVIAWSIGNEVGEQGDKRSGVIIAKLLSTIVKQEDTTRPTTIGNDNPDAGFNGFETATDVFGYNYKPHLYSKFKETHPHIPLYGSETTSALSTRGEYLFPVDNDKAGGKLGFFMSSYDLNAVPWGCIPDTEFKAQDEVAASAGEFVWTGFDYLGEPTPFTADMTVLTNYHNDEERAKAEKELKEAGKIAVPSRSSYFGIVDLAGFKKDRFYLYQARWNKDLPMAHILPHWNWDERVGQVTPIHVYTSGDSAELFLNGKSLGKKTIGDYEYRLRWDSVVYEPGEVKVIAYKNGKEWATETIKTTGKPAKIGLEADRHAMDADGYDLIFVTANIEDKEGLIAPRSNNRIDFEVKGPARIVATDNGDQTSHASFQNPYINAFNGKALVILKSKKGEKGTIKLTAKSKGLKQAEIKLEAK